LIENTPDIYILESRKEIDEIRGISTSSQDVGWAKNRNIFLLDYKKIETESSYKLTPEQYIALIKHELNHLFFNIVSGGTSGPIWFREGFSIFLSGQTTNGQWEKPGELIGFIESEGENKKYAYSEGGFVVELLVDKFGKEKVIQLVKRLKSIASDQDFKQTFNEIFGIELSYDSINNLYLK